MPVPTSIALTISSPCNVLGSASSLTAILTGSNATIATGTVTFNLPSGVLTQVAVANGVAFAGILADSVGLGTFPITASYAGDANNAPSTSNAVTWIVYTPPPAGYTLITSTELKDATGKTINNATIAFLPVANNGTPLSFRSGGVSGQTTAQAVSTVVTDGAFSVALADTSLTVPVNIGYRVTCTDNVSGKVLLANGYSCIQPTGAAWNFDSYLPNFAAQITVQQGPSGLSAYQIYEQAGGLLTEAGWLASLQGTPGVGGVNLDFFTQSTLPSQIQRFNPQHVGVGTYVNLNGIFTAYAALNYTTPFLISGVSSLIANFPIYCNSGYAGIALFNSTGTYLQTFFPAPDNSASKIPANTVIPVPSLPGAKFAILQFLSADVPDLTQAMIVVSLNSSAPVIPSSYVSATPQLASDTTSEIASAVATVNATTQTAIAAAIAAQPPSTAGLKWRGAFNANSTYAPNDVIGYGSDSYICIAATAPNNTGQSVNIFDQTAVTANYLVKSTDGTLAASNNFTATGFIDLLDPGTGAVASSWTSNNVVGCYSPASEGVAYYSSPNQASYVGGNPDPAGTQTNSVPPTTVQNPNGYRYLRFTIAPTGNMVPLGQTMVVRGSSLPSSYVAYGAVAGSAGGAAIPTDTSHWTQIPSGGAGSYPISGFSWMNFGDSISAAYNLAWQTRAASLTQSVYSGLNRAASGRIWLELFGEYIVSGAINQMALQADLQAQRGVVIFMGTNDATQLRTSGLQLGTISDTPFIPLNVQGTSQRVYNSQNSLYATIMGAVDLLDLLAPLVPKLIVGPYHHDRQPGSPYPAGGFDETLSNPYVDTVNAALAAVAASRGHRFLNLASVSGFNKNTVLTATGAPLLTVDGLHPSTPLGFDRIAKPMAEEMSKAFI